MSSYSEQVKKDARAAADYIREHGWCQNVLESDGRVCMYGAIERIAPEHDNRSRMLIEALRENVPEYLIAQFNDASGRTKEEVLEVFDKIANS